MERTQKIEIAAAAAITVAAVGGIAIRYAQYARLHYSGREPDPTILNESRLGSKKLERINLIAAYILTNEHTTRLDIVRDLAYHKSDVSHLIGHLMDRGLVARITNPNADQAPHRYFVATLALYDALQDTQTYGRLSASIECMHE